MLCLLENCGSKNFRVTSKLKSLARYYGAVFTCVPRAYPPVNIDIRYLGAHNPEYLETLIVHPGTLRLSSKRVDA